MDNLNSILLAINILLMVLVIIGIAALTKYFDSVVALHNAIKDCFDVDNELVKSIIDSNDSIRVQCEDTEKAYDLVMKQYESMEESYKLVMEQYEQMYPVYMKILDIEDQRYKEFKITCNAEK